MKQLVVIPSTATNAAFSRSEPVLALVTIRKTSETQCLIFSDSPSFLDIFVSELRIRPHSTTSFTQVALRLVLGVLLTSQFKVVKARFYLRSSFLCFPLALSPLMLSMALISYSDSSTTQSRSVCSDTNDDFWKPN